MIDMLIGNGKRIGIPFLRIIAAVIFLYALFLISLMVFGRGAFEWWSDRFSDDPTRYSVGYDEAKFKSLQPGVSVKDVLTALGAPLREVSMCERALDRIKKETACNRRLLIYSEQVAPHDDYKVRNLIVQDEKGIEIVHEYFIE